MSLGVPTSEKRKFVQEILKSPPPPPISKRSPKYADHPPNAGHGFAALVNTTVGMKFMFDNSVKHQTIFNL